MIDSGNMITPAPKNDCHSYRARDSMIVSFDSGPRIYDGRSLHPLHDRRQTITNIVSRSSNGCYCARPLPIEVLRCEKRFVRRIRNCERESKSEFLGAIMATANHCLRCMRGYSSFGGAEHKFRTGCCGLQYRLVQEVNLEPRSASCVGGGTEKKQISHRSLPTPTSYSQANIYSQTYSRT